MVDDAEAGFAQRCRARRRSFCRRCGCHRRPRRARTHGSRSRMAVRISSSLPRGEDQRVAVAQEHATEARPEPRPRRCPARRCPGLRAKPLVPVHVAVDAAVVAAAHGDLQQQAVRLAGRPEDAADVVHRRRSIDARERCARAPGTCAGPEPAPVHGQPWTASLQPTLPGRPHDRRDALSCPGFGARRGRRRGPGGAVPIASLCDFPRRDADGPHARRAGAGAAVRVGPAALCLSARHRVPALAFAGVAPDAAAALPRPGEHSGCVLRCRDAAVAALGAARRFRGRVAPGLVALCRRGHRRRAIAAGAARRRWTWWCATVTSSTVSSAIARSKPGRTGRCRSSRSPTRISAPSCRSRGSGASASARCSESRTWSCSRAIS